MAEQHNMPHILRWRRTPDGRLVIAVGVEFVYDDKAMVTETVAFIFSKEEESRLLAFLQGIVVADALPENGNIRHIKQRG